MQTAGFADRAEILFHLVLAHADAVVAHGQRPRVLVRLDADGKIAAAQADVLVGQRPVGQLVDCIGCVRQDLSQEDLLMRIN